MTRLLVTATARQCQQFFNLESSNVTVANGRARCESFIILRE